MKLNAYQAIEQLQQANQWAYDSGKLTAERYQAKAAVLQIIADKLQQQDEAIKGQIKLANTIQKLEQQNERLQEILKCLQLIYSGTGYDLPPFNILNWDDVKRFYYTSIAKPHPYNFVDYCHELQMIKTFERITKPLPPGYKNSFNRELQFFKVE